nr:hypothetical protein [Agrobacterium vitis]
MMIVGAVVSEDERHALDQADAIRGRYLVRGQLVCRAIDRHGTAHGGKIGEEQLRQWTSERRRSFCRDGLEPAPAKTSHPHHPTILRLPLSAIVTAKPDTCETGAQSLDNGRIYDHELVEAVQRIAGNGTGDTRWKVPGVLDWSTGVYNPRVDITKDITTLYASDRDVFLFLVDDLNPIEAGRLPDGSPDLYFRGFYCWNSEVGAKTLGMASFYLRAVCQNRNLWGVEDFEEITIRHSKYAASRFAHEAAPALLNFANSSPKPFVNGIKAARERIVARTDEDRTEFLRKRGFSKAETGKIIETVLLEEGRPPESIFDFVAGITAVARDKTHQDARLELEGKAKKLLDRAA